MFMNGIGDDRLKALTKHYAKEGAEARCFNYKGRNSKALTLEDSQRIVTFLEQTAQVHALDLPGRLPGEGVGYKICKINCVAWIHALYDVISYT